MTQKVIMLTSLALALSTACGGPNPEIPNLNTPTQRVFSLSKDAPTLTENARYFIGDESSAIEVWCDDTEVLCGENSVQLPMRYNTLLIFDDNAKHFSMGDDSLNTTLRWLSVEPNEEKSISEEETVCDAEDPATIDDPDATGCIYPEETIDDSTPDELIEEALLEFLSSKSGAALIPNGFPSAIGEMVGICIGSVCTVASCSGTMINNRFIITAAHCFDNLYPGTGPQSLVVSTPMRIRRLNTQVFNGSATAYRHPLYSEISGTSAHNNYDLAVIRLSTLPSSSARGRFYSSTAYPGKPTSTWGYADPVSWNSSQCRFAPAATAVWDWGLRIKFGFTTSAFSGSGDSGGAGTFYSGGSPSRLLDTAVIAQSTATSFGNAWGPRVSSHLGFIFATAPTILGGSPISCTTFSSGGYSYRRCVN